MWDLGDEIGWQERKVNAWFLSRLEDVSRISLVYLCFSKNRIEPFFFLFFFRTHVFHLSLRHERKKKNGIQRNSSNLKEKKRKKNTYYWNEIIFSNTWNSWNKRTTERQKNRIVIRTENIENNLSTGKYSSLGWNKHRLIKNRNRSYFFSFFPFFFINNISHVRLFRSLEMMRPHAHIHTQRHAQLFKPQFNRG